MQSNLFNYNITNEYNEEIDGPIPYIIEDLAIDMREYYDAENVVKFLESLHAIKAYADKLLEQYKGDRDA